MKRFSNIAAAVCLLLAIGLTALALLTSYYGWSVYFELISHFQVQYFVATLMLAVVTLCLRRMRLALPILFCSAVLSAQVIPWYLPLGDRADAANYRVLSANLNRGNSDAARVLEWVETEQPDLALFMEVNEQMAEELTALKARLPYSSQSKDAEELGMVLYSKVPLSDLQLERFGTESINLTAQMQVAGQPVSLVAIHPLPPFEGEYFRDRNRLFLTVSEYVQAQSDPVLLLGDLNITMWSPYYRSLIRQSGLRNTRRGMGILPTWPEQPIFGFLSNQKALLKLIQIPIDHCLTSPDLTVADMHVGADIGSDHLPIVVDFSLAG
ncbi:MAG: endonuclease/exonuclease/phosphatase family protein [Phormidesmis sp.]